MFWDMERPVTMNFLKKNFNYKQCFLFPTPSAKLRKNYGIHGQIFIYIYMCVCVCVCHCINRNFPPGFECDTKSIFKRSKPFWIHIFLFLDWLPNQGYRTKFLSISLSYCVRVHDGCRLKYEYDHRLTSHDIKQYSHLKLFIMKKSWALGQSNSSSFNKTNLKV